MKRVTLIVPGWLGDPESDSVLRGRPVLAQIAARSQVFHLQDQPGTMPESGYLGLRGLRMADGPLTLSAFGYDPPQKSTQFHLSLVSVIGDALSLPPAPSAEERKVLLAEAKRLNTKRLTVVEGGGVDHGLVWEDGSLEVRCTAPVEVKNWSEDLPTGDGEVMLRQFIDDSMNLFGEHEINLRRIDEGLPPLSLLWPWAPGRRPSIPNLALQLGEIVSVQSGSRRLAGLTRLAGHKHGPWQTFGSGTAVQLGTVRKGIETSDANVVLIESFLQFRQQEQMDEMDWLTNEIETKLLDPLLTAQDPLRLTILSPNGLGMTGVFPGAEHNTKPFDERSLEESLPSDTTPEAVWKSLLP